MKVTKDNKTVAVKLAKCRAEYLGSEVPLETAVGKEAIYGPLRELWHKRNVQNYKNTDVWIRVFSSGISIHFLHTNTIDWIPISNVNMCAAVKCMRIEENGELFGERVPIFAPIPLAQDSDHPPLFVFQMRRTEGVKHLDCLIFSCRNDEAARALVASVNHAHEDKTKWHHVPPPSKSLIAEDMQNRSKKNRIRNILLRPIPIPVIVPPPRPVVLRYTQSLPDQYIPINHVQNHTSDWVNSNNPEEFDDILTVSPNEQNATVTSTNTIRGFSINGIFMDDDGKVIDEENNNTEKSRQQSGDQQPSNNTNKQLTDDNVQQTYARPAAFPGPIPQPQVGNHNPYGSEMFFYNRSPQDMSPPDLRMRPDGRVHQIPSRLYYSMYDMTGRDRPMPFARSITPPPGFYAPKPYMSVYEPPNEANIAENGNRNSTIIKDMETKEKSLQINDHI